MAQTIFGTDYSVAALNRAFNNTSPAYAVFQSQKGSAGTTQEQNLAFAEQFGAQYANVSDADLATQVLTNLGVLPSTNEDVLALQEELTDYFGIVSQGLGADARGVVVLQLATILSGLENATGDQAVYAEAAKLWNKEVENAFVYSSNPANTTPQQGDDGSGTTTLTRFTDVLTGETFTGYLDYNQYTGVDEQTLTTGDRLTGTDGENDTLFAQLLSGTTRPTLNGVEIVSIDAKGATPTLDLSDANGVKTVANVNSSETSTLAFQGLKNLVDVQIRNTNSNTTVAFNASVTAGVADALNLLVNGAGVKAKAANFTVAGVEELNITTEGAASVLGNVATGNNLTSVTITGDQNLAVGTKAAGTGFLSNAIATVDASEATGDLFLNVAASAARTQTVTTGTGDDVVVTGDLNAVDKFDLGEGNDRLVLTTVSTNEAAKLLGVEEVEARVAGTNLNLTNAADVTLLAVAETAGFGNVTAVKSGTTVAFEGKGQDNAVSNSAVTFGGVKFNLANATGSSDVIDFTFNNGGIALGADSTVTIGALTNTGNNVETINLDFSDVVASNLVTVQDINVGSSLKTLTVSSDSKVTLQNVNDLTKLTSVDATEVKGAFTATFGALADAANATVKLGGSGANQLTVDKAQNLGGAAATSNTLLTVDASAGTGVQTVNVTNNDTNTTAPATNAALVAKAGVAVTGGAGADVINVNTVADAVSTIRGGAGADKINLTGVGTDVLVYALGDTGSTAAGADVVTGFTTAQDKIDLRSFGFDSNLFTNIATTGTTTGATTDFTVGGVQYAVNAVSAAGSTTVYIDTNGDSRLGDGDLVIFLSGTAAVAAGDFMFV
ncbi:hypothetical protein SAMN05428957_10494 [Oryzisolibacter propanilivorax]|uniref:S-layer protein n=1 Tax=Oryzisolibacter propanilivorax TaxID=1527607 RepID=A0A1G9S421_9BURK|nr:hypothetical protein [Oryzisolibacter propanilivorax]SDM30253.1 hypothetical protein SAMN05428957_10494 [Oryzisolibacter propanilivorax]